MKGQFMFRNAPISFAVIFIIAMFISGFVNFLLGFALFGLAVAQLIRIGRKEAMFLIAFSVIIFLTQFIEVGLASVLALSVFSIANLTSLGKVNLL